tara:strand:- start:1253 stop:2140 length:888 start_codon:yes stop_codon:yes gene_type:complete
MTANSEELEIKEESASIRLSELIREEREKADFSVERAAAATRITISFIKAIEGGDFKQLPGYIFVRGFIRSLCRIYESDKCDQLLELYDDFCSEEGIADAVIGQPNREETSSSGVVTTRSRTRSVNRFVRGLYPGNYFRTTPLYIAQGGFIVACGLVYLLYSSLSSDQTVVEDSNEESKVVVISKAVDEKKATTELSPVLLEEPTQTDGVQRLSMEIPVAMSVKYKIDKREWVSQVLAADSYEWEFKDRAEFFLSKPEGISITYNEQPIGPLKNLTGHHRLTFAKPDGSIKSQNM